MLVEVNGYLRGGLAEEKAAVGDVGAVVGGLLVQARFRGQEDPVEDVAQLGPVMLFGKEGDVWMCVGEQADRALVCV